MEAIELIRKDIEKKNAEIREAKKELDKTRETIKSLRRQKKQIERAIDLLQGKTKKKESKSPKSLEGGNT